VYWKGFGQHLAGFQPHFVLMLHSNKAFFSKRKLIALAVSNYSIVFAKHFSTAVDVCHPVFQ